MDNLLFRYLTYGIIALGFLWILTDPRPNIEKYKLLIKPSRIYYYLFLIGSYISQYFLIYQFPNIKIPGGLFLTTVGLIIYIIGFFIGIWAKITMGKFWGPPGQHDAKRQRKIIIKGPFYIFITFITCQRLFFSIKKPFNIFCYTTVYKYPKNNSS